MTYNASSTDILASSTIIPASYTFGIPGEAANIVVPTADDYLELITPYHRGKPKFVATVRALVEPVSEIQNLIAWMWQDFDLDHAIGVQLDQVGQWVGRSRYVNIPLVDVWFGFDKPGLGWDQGIWKGRFDPDTGIAALDDDTYRLLLKLKIIANQWDGTIDSIREPMELFFGGAGIYIYIEDRADMSMITGLSGRLPNAALLSLLVGGYIPLKPEGVTAHYIVTSVDRAPIFGFDVDNNYISGWDSGSWGVTPSYADSY